MKTLKTIVIALVVSFGLMATSNAQSKVAHINSQEFVQNLPTYKSVNDRTGPTRKTYRTEIDDLLKEAQKQTSVTNEKLALRLKKKTKREQWNCRKCNNPSWNTDKPLLKIFRKNKKNS